MSPAGLLGRAVASEDPESTRALNGQRREVVIKEPRVVDPSIRP